MLFFCDNKIVFIFSHSSNALTFANNFIFSPSSHINKILDFIELLVSYIHFSNGVFLTQNELMKFTFNNLL